MRLAIAQINTHLGNCKKNAETIISYSKRAAEKKADVVAFPELSLFGYPTSDLLEDSQLVNTQKKLLQQLSKTLPKNIYVVLGAVIKNKTLGEKPYFNSAVVFYNGKIIGQANKQLLPSYDVFDDTRFFESGKSTLVLKLKKFGPVAISVCEDMWAPTMRLYKKNPLHNLKGLKLAINISSSPFSLQKEKLRIKTARLHVKKLKCPFLYVNQVGAQDEVIFDGRSFVLDSKGKLVSQASAFQEDLLIVDLASGRSEYRPTALDSSELLRLALVTGIRDFCSKLGLQKIHLGLSGGIDSSVAACLAVDAIGPKNVVGLTLPGPFSSKGSVADSAALAKNLGIKLLETKIQKTFSVLSEDLNRFSNESNISDGAIDIAKQNIQARIRGLLLMLYGNLHNSLLLTTSNKSELATGFSTLYGDTCGGLAPLGDLLKYQVYELAELYNKGREIIPQAVLSKAPSAELAPNQKDEDSLPPYSQLDVAVEKLVTQKKSPSNDLEKWLKHKIYQSEFKRWQSPPILRVSEHAFGRGRRMPLATYSPASKSS